MVFRDEKEALHAQIDVLRRELEEEQAARSRDAEEAAAVLKREREKLKELRRKGAPQSRTWIPVVAMAAVMAASGLVFFLARSDSQDPPEPEAAASKPDARVKPDAEVRSKTPLEEILHGLQRRGISSWDRLRLTIAAAVAHASVGKNKQALSLLAKAEKTITADWYEHSKAEGHGLIACGLTEAGAAGPAKKKVQQVMQMVDGLQSNERELEIYEAIAEGCVDMGVRPKSAQPFLSLLLASSAKQGDKSVANQAFLRVAELKAEQGDAEGLTALVKQVMTKRLRTYDPAFLAQVAEQLWRAGDQKRAKELLAAAKPRRDADGDNLASIARGLAMAGRTQQARTVLERAVAALRKESGSALELRKEIAVAYACLGDLDQAKRIHTFGPFPLVLVEADRLNEAYKLHAVDAAAYRSYQTAPFNVEQQIAQMRRQLALKLVRAGRPHEASSVARRLLESDEHLALAAVFTILNKRVAQNTEQK